MFEFVWPLMFLALPLPLLVYLLFPAKENKQSSAALKVPFPIQLGPSQVSKQSYAKVNLFLMALLWLLLVTASARPQWLGEPIAIPTEGRDLMVAVDLSGSMKARDMVVNAQAVNRLTMIKYVLSDFISRRVGDRLGLILFADTAYLQAPLTFDRPTVETLLKESVIGLVGDNTAIGDAIGLAVKRFRQREKSNRVLILLTDGRNTAGNISPEQALSLAKDNEVTIYTIGVGSNQRDMFGFTMQSGASFDEATLNQIAEETGGQFFRATDTESLINIYRQLDALEPIEEGTQQMRPQTALYFYPMGLALLMSAIFAIFVAVHSIVKRGKTND
ncbi:vWA domain-containing protein [Agaribacter marinus]|uniref:VWR domain protein in aerotolerance operon BatA n=1 Tax=Agaribacter marinus TaxID=1431249 RepID=A0AA37T1S1_9ALTE|nr:VWA domain-containing protein [Agaribacter marinus]GLR72026.1 VWR domain protein in aerotolerance operon BatA [Agaribacter marinus]